MDNLRCYHPVDIYQMEKYSQTAISIWDMETLTIIDANYATELLTGFLNVEVAGQPASIFIPDEMADWWANSMLPQLKERGYSEAFEVKLTRKDGDTRFIRIQSFVLRDQNSDKKYIKSIIQDFTEAKKAKQENVELIKRLLAKEASERLTQKPKLIDKDLSDTEILVAYHTVKNKNAKQVALSMGISVNTVNNHRQSIRNKLGIAGSKSSFLMKELLKYDIPCI